MIVVIRKAYPTRVFADLTEAEYASFGHKYPAADFDVWRTDEPAYAPGPLPKTYVVVERPEGGNA